MAMDLSLVGQSNFCSHRRMVISSVPIRNHSMVRKCFSQVGAMRTTARFHLEFGQLSAEINWISSLITTLGCNISQLSNQKNTEIVAFYKELPDKKQCFVSKNNGTT